MTAQIKFPYKIEATGLYCMIMNDANEHLRMSLGTFEVWNEGNAADYNLPLTPIINTNGVFGASLPPIDIALLPMDVHVYIFDPVTIANGPIGQGTMRIDRLNNEQPSDKLLCNIYAATVGKTLGVGTVAEEYYGYDDFLGFTTTFDTAGNRIVVVE